VRLPREQEELYVRKLSCLGRIKNEVDLPTIICFLGNLYTEIVLFREDRIMRQT
jgi:hypothetical protein